MKQHGHEIKGYEWKDGKLVKKFRYRDASHAIRVKKSKKVRVAKSMGGT